MKGDSKVFGAMAFHIYYMERGNGRHLVLCEIHICYKETMVGVCHKVLSVIRRWGWKMFVMVEFHICYKERGNGSWLL